MPQTLPSLAQLAADVRQVLPQACAAWLYGSAARGELASHSDIDVAVLFTPEVSKTLSAIELLGYVGELERRWGRAVDLINLRQVSNVLQKEVIAAQTRLFAADNLSVDEFELNALALYRDYNERFRHSFERIAKSGKVYA